MTTRTQGLVAAMLAAVLIRVSLSGEYLRFVLPWMQWPLLLTGAVLLLMSLRPALGLRPASDPGSRSSWLLLVPTIVVFTVAPPPLGAYFAEQRGAGATAPYQGPHSLPDAREDQPLDVGVDEFVWGASQEDDAMGLSGQPVRMIGFVSTDHSGAWYVTRLVIFCCAADAVVERVQVVGEQAAPQRDHWVRITGTWVPGTGTDIDDPTNPAQVRIDDLVGVPTPKRPYG